MAQQQQRYRVIEKIAAGGMAEVYRAESAGLEGFKKTVAIKRVLPHLSKKKEFIGMFLDEARLSATLSHSNVVQVFDIGVGDDTYFIVMEFVDGANLKAIIDHRRKQGVPLTAEMACLIGLRICEGLSYAHEARDALGQPLGIVHRDVSPPNVLVTAHGEVKVVDFGLAKANSQLESSEPGVIKGKFSYLSPEAALGETVDHRTDIFATGIILWEMLTGRRLFLGDTDLATVRQVQAAKVDPPSKYARGIPRELEHVLGQALARDPRTRYQTARELGRDLNRILFETKRPVSSFDIAGLVTEVRESERRARGARPKQQTLIGSLIQDAMMSFTSLQDEGTGEPSVVEPLEEESGVGAIPLNFGSFESHDSLPAAAEPSGVSLPASSPFEVGNLAALEDQAPGSPLDMGQLMSQPGGQTHAHVPPYSPAAYANAQQHAIAGASLGDPQRAEALAHASTPPPSPARTFVAVFALLLLIAGATAAYFAGVFD